MARSNITPLILLGLPLAFFAAFFLAPMCVVAVSSLSDPKGTFTIANYMRILLDQYHWDILLLIISFVASLVGRGGDCALSFSFFRCSPATSFDPSVGSSCSAGVGL